MVWVLVGEDLNIPTVFQIHVNDVLLDFINHFVFVYFDNILIFSKLPQEHESHIKQVLCRKKSHPVLFQLHGALGHTLPLILLPVSLHPLAI